MRMQGIDGEPCDGLRASPGLRQPDTARKEQVLLVDEQDQRNRHTQQLRREARQPSEGLLG